MQLDLVDGGHDPGGIDEDVEVLGFELLTPMDRIRPWSRRWANALKVSTNLFSPGTGQCTSYRSR